jgi:large subunit ribosomal protein L9
MQTLLNKDVKTLGYRGDVVNVKKGYFRNFLNPRGLAQIVTPSVLKLSEVRNKKRVLRKQQVIDNAKEVLGRLKGLSVTLKSKVSEKGKLYGSISDVEVIRAIKDASGVELEKEFVKAEHIKEVGEHKVNVTLGEGLEEQITVVVEAA